MTVGALQVVCWDLDGTLYDRDALRLAVRQQIMRSVRPQRWRKARNAGRALRQHRHHEQRVRAAGGVVDAEAGAFWSGALWQEFSAQFLLPALQSEGPFDAAVQLLQRATEAGLRCVVVSDFPVDAKLEALGLSMYFSSRFAGTDLGALKPHRSVFAHVLSELDVSPSAVLHVGDRADTDGVAAAGAGVRFCHVVRGDFAPVAVALERAAAPL